MAKDTIHMGQLRGLAMVAVAWIGIVAACDGRETPSDAGPDWVDAGDDPGTAPVTVRFEHSVDGTPLELTQDSTPYTSAAGNAYSLSRLSYFISNVSLTMADGSTVTALAAHYVDHKDDVSRSYLLPTEVAPGSLQSLSFVMGIPAAQNTTGAFPNPPESLMSWPDSMGGGYHYMKLEGRYLNTAGDLANLRAHSGPTDGSDYTFPVTLDATNHDVSDDGATLTVVMNIDQWFTDPHTWDFNDYFQIDGMMADAAKQAELMENGATVFTLED